jgi:formylglycine-generating enzyme required for sulfatase activity
MTRRGSIDRFSAAALLLTALAVWLIPGCSQDASTVVQPADKTPPAASALRLTAVTPTSATLSWQAPGDDELRGTADRYDLRYATSPIDEQSFTTGTAVPGMIRPGVAREGQQFTITGLIAGQTYFFGLRTADQASNWSPISGIINVTLPELENEPVLWSARGFPEAGTILTAFLYQVRLRRSGGQPLFGAPEVVIGEAAYPMRPQTDDGVSISYTFSLLLPAGSYDYRFRYVHEDGHVTYLPSSGVWSGPAVGSAGSIEFDSVAVPVDTFRMGSIDANTPRDEQPAHQVALTRSFLMDRREITNAQFCLALNWGRANGLITVVADTTVLSRASRKPLMVTASLLAGTAYGIRYTTETGFTPLPFREDWPVTYATWYGAAFFCNARSLHQGLPAPYDEARGWICGPQGVPYEAEGWRLPTETEWEYAARYNDERIYPTGDLPPVAGTTASFGPRSAGPQPVGSYPSGASGLGILDLSGNVWEWCNDWLDFYQRTTGPGGVETVQIDPVGPRDDLTFRVARGGSWGSRVSDLRCARRLGVRPDKTLGGMGFRCVRTGTGP